MSRPRKNLGRYKKIVYLRDVKHKKFREIAAELGTTRQRVWQIYQRAVKNGMSKVDSEKIRHMTCQAGLLESTTAA